MARSHWGLCSICPLVMGLFLISGLPWLTWKTFRNHFHLSHINRLWLQWVKCPHGQRQGWEGWHYKTWNWVLSPVFFPLYLNHSIVESDRNHQTSTFYPALWCHCTQKTHIPLLASTSHYEKDVLLYCILHTSSPMFWHPTTSHPVTLERNTSSRKWTVTYNLWLHNQCK